MDKILAWVSDQAKEKTAELVAGSAVGSAVVSAVWWELNFLRNALREVDLAGKKLKDIKFDLKKPDFMGDKEEEEELDILVSEVRDLAVVVKDLIEVFKNNATPYRGYNVLKLSKGLYCQITTIHKVIHVIDDFNRKHAKLFTERSGEDGEILTPGAASARPPPNTQRLRETSRDLREKGGPSSKTKEDDIVGFEEVEENLRSRLTTNDREQLGRLIIVSIWGTPGAGKTSLAHKIYKNGDVKKHFINCVAWATVTQKCDVKGVWQAILEQIWNPKEEEKKKFLKVDVDIEIVREKVYDCLTEKDYLIILDDIWEKKNFDELIKAFPESPQKKCRILLTSRETGVAGVATHCEHLRFLNDDESMELFLKKVYRFAQHQMQSVPAQRKHWAKKILTKCKGLPIAIVLVGGILQSGWNDTKAWERLSKRVDSALVGDISKDVLSLSYVALPYDLRPCFLYFGLFPEDSTIDCDRLIRLWLAEGFLEQQLVAEESLGDLIGRSMIQVVQRKSNGDPQTCCMHDLLRWFAKEKAMKGKFSSISEEKPLASSVEGFRRIALHPKYTQDQIPGTSSIVPLQSKHLISSHPQSSLPLAGKRDRARVVEGDDLVVFGEEVNKLVSLLKNEEPLGRLAVVSIVSEQGIGKTAVAQKVYDNVKSQFDFSAWVHVSTDSAVRVKHFLWTILGQVTSDAEMKGDDELHTMFHDLLKKKNYLIVLDNLRWGDEWNAIKGIFPNPLEHQKSRVLLVTMQPQKPVYADRSIDHVRLMPLDKDLSLKLFLKTVSKHSHDELIQEASLSEKMRDMARKMVVEYCEGLPCAIVALGSLISEKAIDGSMDSVWNETLKSLNQKVAIESVYRGVHKVFLVCFLGLPVHLRSCICSFMCFPAFNGVERKTLVKQWDGEGLLKSENNRSIEDVATDYLQVLIRRKLVDVEKGGRSNDHQRYMLQSQLYFSMRICNCFGLAEDSRPPPFDHPKDSEQVQYGTSTTLPPPSQAKSFSLSQLAQLLSSFGDVFKFPNHVYSFLCFSKNPQFSLDQFPLLGVVDLQSAEKMEKVPNEIRNLTLLRYLCLRGTRVKLIPTWIADLRKLQTLDAPNSKIPIEALNLHQLRYLFVDSFYDPTFASAPEEHSASSSSSSRLCVNIGLLKHLHTLELDTADCIIIGLDKLTSLRVLRLRCGEDSVFRLNDGEDEDDVFGAVAMLTRLKSLYLNLKKGDSSTSSSSQHTDDARPMHSLSFSSHSDLDEMILRGTMVKLPELDFPRHVTYLWLETYVDNDVDPFSTLQHLPSLKKLCLRLHQAVCHVVNSKMTCCTGGFAELEYLYISVDYKINHRDFPFTWTVEPGALRNLRVLHIEANDLLNSLGGLPVGLRYVTTLEELVITRGYDVRKKLIHRKGKVWKEVEGIQSLSIKYLNESNMKP